MTTPSSKIAELIAANQKDMIEEWLGLQKAAITARIDLLPETDLRREGAEFLALLTTACRSAGLADIGAAGWEAVRGFLGDLSRSRASAGFSPSETVTFVFSFKQPLFARLRKEYGANAGPGRLRSARAAQVESGDASHSGDRLYRHSAQ